jgi:hypothetical protein
MNIDLILYIIFMIPLVWIGGFKIDKLKDNRVFFKYFMLSVIMLIIGITLNYYSENESKSASYFGSQMLIVFLLMQKILRKIFCIMFHREPFFGRYFIKFPDFVYSLILATSVMTFPFLIDSFIVQKYVA